MATNKGDNLLYFKAALAFDSFRLAIKMFEAYLGAAGPASSPDYYKARNYLRDGEKFYAETFAEAKKLLGPLPPYSTAEFEKWRSDFVTRHKILAESQEFAALKEEMSHDGQIGRWIEPADLDRLLTREYEPQKSGKRKLANIKARIILDRLQELAIRANDLKKKAQEKLQGRA